MCRERWTFQSVLITEMIHGGVQFGASYVTQNTSELTAFYRNEVQGGAKEVSSCEYTKECVVLLIYYCIIFHMNNWKPPFDPSCMYVTRVG